MPAGDSRSTPVDLCLLRFESLGEGVVVTARMIRDVSGDPVERTFTTTDMEELLQTLREFADRSTGTEA